MSDFDKVMPVEPDPLDERVAAILKACRLFAALALFVYLGGAAITYTVHFADERDACYDAGGFLGRIWCPDSVATDGLTVHLARAASWPVILLQAPVESAGSFAQATEAMKRGDYPLALRTWQPLAQRGDARAQFNLGLMYEDGLGVDQDYTEAAKWHRASAGRGLAVAQNSLGLLYKYGLGVGQDYGEAVKWFTAAARQGDEGALSNLGLMYQEGLGVAQNDAEAVRWFRLAAEQGEGEAQLKLSIAYLSGRGTRRDHIEAYKWASLAAAQGVERALPRLDKLASTMSKGQIAEAEKRIREWEPPAEGEVSARLRKFMEQARVSNVQALLNELGYQVGNPDGVAGPRTRAAITEFQLRDGMPPSGEISAELIARLENGLRAHKLKAAQDRNEQALPSQRSTVIAHNCDLQAADYSDKSRPASVAGVAFSKIDANRAIAACKQAVDHFPDNARYQFQLARGLRKAGRHQEAVGFYRAAAERGFVLAQKKLGLMYANGDGIARDLGAAAEWLRLAAEQGDVDAQFGLANFYAAGRGVRKDTAQAVAWYKKAAAQNHPEARSRLLQIGHTN